MTTEARPSVPAPVPAAAPTGASSGTVWSRVLALPLTVLAIAVGLALVLYTAPSLLLLFAGILFATLLDACTRGLGHILPVARAWRFALVTLVFASLAALAIGWGIVRLPAQAQHAAAGDGHAAWHPRGRTWRPSASICSVPAAGRTSRISSPIPAGCSATSSMR